MEDAGLLWLPAAADEQCSDVYFFLGTRALKVAVLRLEAGLGLLLALGVLLLLQLLSPLVGSFPESIADASDSGPSPSEVSRPLAGSARGDSECERDGGDLLLSLFSSESRFSPPSEASPAPRRFPPLARVEGGERRPCFFIGFIFSSSLPFLQTLFIYLFIPEILLHVLLVLRPPTPPPVSAYFPLLFLSSARASLSHPVSSSVARRLPPYSRDSERKASKQSG